MNCELGPLSRPDGSALFTLGKFQFVDVVLEIQKTVSWKSNVIMLFR